jgi:hypothetical protein
MNKNMDKKIDRRSFLKNFIFIVAGSVLGGTALSSCDANDPAGAMYTEGLYPPTKDTYNVGNETLRWKEGHFKDIYANGSLIDFTDYNDPALIELAKIGSPTYHTLQDFVNSFGSAGRKTGGIMTDVGSSKIAVSAGTGFIKATDDDNTTLLFFDFPAPLDITIPADSVRYIGVEYNSGTPQVVSRISWNWDLDSEFPLGRVINETINGVEELYIANVPWWVTDGMTNIMQWARGFGLTRRDESSGGLMLSATGTRNISVTAGKVWVGLNDLTYPGLDTSSSGIFGYYWYKSGSGWQVSDSTQYSVLQYNDITQTTLQNLSANKYANIWIYGELKDNTPSVAVLYPQAQYNTAVDAAKQPAPSLLPAHISNNGLLIGKIIFKQGVDAPIEVASAFTTMFGLATPTNHNNLSSLQGGVINEYYHFTQAQYEALLALIT